MPKTAQFRYQNGSESLPSYRNPGQFYFRDEFAGDCLLRHYGTYSRRRRPCGYTWISLCLRIYRAESASRGRTAVNEPIPSPEPLPKLDMVAVWIADLCPRVGLANPWAPDDVDTLGLPIVGRLLHIVDFEARSYDSPDAHSVEPDLPQRLGMNIRCACYRSPIGQDRCQRPSSSGTAAVPHAR